MLTERSAARLTEVTVLAVLSAGLMSTPNAEAETAGREPAHPLFPEEAGIEENDPVVHADHPNRQRDVDGLTFRSVR